MRNIIFLWLFIVGVIANAYQGRLDPGTWQDSWSVQLHRDLEQSGLMAHEEPQIEKLCGGYRSDTKKRELFWSQLFMSLGWKESMYGPKNYIKFHRGINIGLFQIDPRLRSAYGCSGYDLYKPAQNIQCAVRMASRLVEKFNSFLVGAKGGMAAYWQPLRATSNLNRRNRKAILADVTSACVRGQLIDRSRALVELSEVGPVMANLTDDLELNPEQLDLDTETFL